MTINHIDGNPANNHPLNLELATPLEQALHTYHDLGIDTLGSGRLRGGTPKRMVQDLPPLT